VPLPPPVPDEIAKEKRSQIQVLSRKKYATAKSIVEEQIEKEQADLFDDSEILENETQKPRDPKIGSTKPRGVPVRERTVSKEPELPDVQEERNEKTVPPDANLSPNKSELTHEELKDRFIEAAEKLDYTVKREVVVLGGKGGIDLVFTRGDVKIACEIAMTRPVEDEAGNVRKCSNAEFRRIVVIAINRKRLGRIEKAVGTSVDPDSSVSYFLPEEFVEALGIWAESDPGGGEKERSKPRKQKISFSVDDLTAEERGKNEISMLQSIAETMKRNENS
jgi:hypothetical protein